MKKSYHRYTFKSYQSYLYAIEGRREDVERMRRRRKDLFNKLQSHYGCAHCGLTDHRYLHWNHVDPSGKGEAVSNLYNRTFMRILDEIRKCNVLCHACHQEETARQREHGKINHNKKSRLTQEEWEQGRRNYIYLRDNNLL